MKGSGATDEFIEQYKVVTGYIKKSQPDTIRTEIKKLAEIATNHYEQSRVHYLKSSYYEITDQPWKRLKELDRVSQYAKDHFSDAQHEQILISKLILQTSFNLYSEAMNTFDTLQTIFPNHASAKEISAYMADVNALISSSEFIDVQAKIDTNKRFYRYSLARKGFSLHNVQGKLNEVEVRCGYKYSTYQAKVNHVWNIPKSWGSCEVFVYGDKGSSFIITEQPDVTTADKIARLN